MSETCPDCGKEYDRLEQHIRMSDCNKNSSENGIEMEEECSTCGSSLRRRERLTEHPNFDGRALFEAYVECDHGEYVLGATSVPSEEIPDGWLE